MAVGLVGYGLSLVMFVLALRGLGTARTGAYFSTAPFIGAAVALLVFGESAGPINTSPCDTAVLRIRSDESVADH